MNVAAALLVCAVLGTHGADSWDVIPLLKSSEGGVELVESSARILNGIEGPVEVVLIAEMGEGLDFALTNAYCGLIAGDNSPFKPLQNDLLDSAHVWMIRAGYNPVTARDRIVLATAFPSCKPTDNHKAAFSVAAIAAQDILFHLPFDSNDMTTRCATLVTKLSLQAELTFKRVHGPVTEEADGHLLVNQERIDLLQMLPSAEIVITGSLHLITESQSDFEKILKPVTSEGGYTALFDKASVRVLPLLPHIRASFPKTEESITLLVKSVTATLSNYHELSFWVHRGSSFKNVLEQGIPLTAPSINIERDPVYSLALKDFVQKKCVEKYSAEMNGVLERGWLIREDGASYMALPQVGAANIVTDDSIITTADFRSLRPPSTAALSSFHTSVVDRLTSQATALLSRFAPEHIPAVTSFISRYASETFEVASVSNKNKIIGFLTEHSKEAIARYINDIGSEQGRYPVQNSAIQEAFEKATKDCFYLFSQYAGELINDPHAEQFGKEMRKQLASEVDSQFKVNADILKSMILTHFDTVVTLTTDFKTKLPTSKSAITLEVKKLEEQAFDLWSELMRQQFDGPVWAESNTFVSEQFKLLKAAVKQTCKQIVVDNRIAIKSFIEKVHQKLQKKFMSEVVNGKAISYPVTSSQAFDISKRRADELIANFKSETEEFSDDESYPALLQEFYTQMQYKICGNPLSESALAASSVMERNVEEWSNQEWVQNAQISTKKQVQKRNGEGNPAEILASKLLEGPKLGSHIDTNLRNKIATSWCVNEGFDCPGICVMWSTKHVHAHWLDVAGLCEPDWWICNPSYEKDIATAKANSRGWKANQEFTNCPAPLPKPCPSYWDRKKKSPAWKYTFRFVYLTHVVAAIIFLATSLLKRR